MYLIHPPHGRYQGMVERSTRCVSQWTIPRQLKHFSPFFFLFATLQHHSHGSQYRSSWNPSGGTGHHGDSANICRPAHRWHHPHHRSWLVPVSISFMRNPAPRRGFWEEWRGFKRGFDGGLTGSNRWAARSRSGLWDSFQRHSPHIPRPSIHLVFIQFAVNPSATPHFLQSAGCVSCGLKISLSSFLIIFSQVHTR